MTNRFRLLEPRAHYLVSRSSPPHSAPPCRAGVSTLLLLPCRPPPHGSLHSSHSLQPLHTQSTGHGCELHSASSRDSPPQASPPHSGSTPTSRVRVLTPPPQLTEHDPNVPQLSHSQWTGQHWPLHVRESKLDPPHSEPPQPDGTATERERLWVPPPHVTEQAPKALHSFQRQSTGQHCVLQALESSPEPVHSAPPQLDVTATDLDLSWVPPPQVAEQEPKDPQLFHSQSTGQHCVLQLLESDAEPVQLGPPQLDGTATDLERLWVPPPQLTEHDPKDPQLLHPQPTGQHWVLHTLESEVEPVQPAPPQLAETATVLDRSWDPPPQLTEHDPKAPYAFHWQSTGQH